MRFWLHATGVNPGDLTTIARLAEDLGFYGLSLGEHLLQPPRSTHASPVDSTTSSYPYSDNGAPPWPPEMSIPDPWVAFAACAAVTTALQFSSNVAIPIHQATTWAKTIATASSLAPGRITLGVGTGWMREEFRAAEAEFAGRGSLLDTALTTMQHLWDGDSIIVDTGDGPTSVTLAPPLPPMRIPIMIGGRAKAALQRAARHDGWLGISVSNNDLVQNRAFIAQERRRLGIEDAAEIVVGLANDTFDPDRYRQARTSGATGITVSIPDVSTSCSHQQRVEQLHTFAERCIQPLREDLPPSR